MRSSSRPVRAALGVGVLGMGLALGLALGLAGCRSGPEPTSRIVTEREDLRTQPGQGRQVEPTAKVVGTVNRIRVTDIRTTTVDGRMQISVTLRNERGRRDVFGVRMRWLDSLGVAAAQYDPWETVALEGGAERVLTLNAPTPRATDFRIELQTND